MNELEFLKAENKELKERLLQAAKEKQSHEHALAASTSYYY